MNLPSRNTLSKEERLYCKKDIDDLLAGGRYASLQVMRYCVRKNTCCPVNRIMISVPKKHFKRAVKRNLIKRRIRESYRLQKSLLPSGGGVDILFIYNSREILDFSAVYEIVGQILENAAK